jgi:hypothetical protein
VGDDFSFLFSSSGMLTICMGAARKRIELMSTRFYTHGELFRMTREQGRNTTIWFEYGPNLYQQVNSDAELRFVCHILEGDIDSFQSDSDREQNKRDVADALHTQSYEASVRGRKSVMNSKNTKHNHTCRTTGELPKTKEHNSSISEDVRIYQSESFLNTYGAST